MSSMTITPRRSEDRGQADHGWLKTFHTFSFASYYDDKHAQFGNLRVINEDRVAPHTGFGTHAHREFEIFSYVVAGELEHRDSMGNIEVLKRGDVQLTSAGTGIRHSEKAYGAKEVHFLQIWSLPSERGLPPKYFTRHFTDDEKRDKWIRVVAPVNAPGVLPTREGTGPTPVYSPVTLHATLLSPSTALLHTLSSASGMAYIHVIQTSGYNPKAATGGKVLVSGGDEEVELREGDGAYIRTAEGASLNVKNVGESTAEVLLFDVE